MHFMHIYFIGSKIPNILFLESNILSYAVIIVVPLYFPLYIPNNGLMMFIHLPVSQIT